MSEIIVVENLSKKYIIRHKNGQKYTALRDVIVNKVKSIGSMRRKNSFEEFWALKDVSFKIKQGERVGIIGRNGAGKSTLLKVLSRITEPTLGKVTLKGRVASLLEVGTGFHPELTGRENIFLNGAILGMSKAEIHKKFDEIVEFAEVEKFLDTPVKRYSSGMYVRLAFAVAAHLEPEILVVDEVLAVGDSQFQKKCLGKMEEVGKEGRTVLFVSHNMPMISSLCDKCILLNKGEVYKTGNTNEIIQTYYSSGIASCGEVDFTGISTKYGDDVAHILAARILDKSGNITTDVDIDESITIEMDYAVTCDGARLTPNYYIYTADGILAFFVTDAPCDPKAELKLKKGVYRSRFTIPGNLLNGGTYYIGFALNTIDKDILHFIKRDLLHFTVNDPIQGVVTRGSYAGVWNGVMRPLLEWESIKIS